MSTSAAADLSAIAVNSDTVRLYWRQCYIPDPPERPNPRYVQGARPSRWRTPRGTLYVAQDTVTVMAEHCRNNALDVEDADPTGGIGLTPGNFAYFAAQPVGNPLDARAVFQIEVTFARLADLRSPQALAVLSAMGVDADDLLADDYGPCPDIAQAGERLGWQAIRARSAARPDGTAVAIFHDAFPAADDWRPVDPEARPTIRTAFLTRYRLGERPAWLGT